jgi:hypothetical protein
MASLIDTLIDVLGQEDAEYKKLLELSNNKTKAIVGADIERLQDILVHRLRLMPLTNWNSSVWKM